MTQHKDQMRAEFEVWAEEYGLSSEPNFNQLTDYDCWSAWTAARASAAQEVPDGYREGWDEGYNEG